MFKLNEPYSQKDFAQVLGLSYKTFANNKKKQLNALSCCCNFEITKKGRTIFYIVTEQWEEYIPITKSQQNIQFIRNKLKCEILIKPDGSLQTAANVGEIIADELKIKPQTAAKYASMVLKQFYGAECGDVGEDGRVDDEKVWAQHKGQTWYLLPQPILQDMISRYKEEKIISGLGDEAEIGAFEDEEESGRKLTSDQLWQERYKLWNRIKRDTCIDHDYRWIMRVKKYLVHEEEEKCRRDA